MPGSRSPGSFGVNTAPLRLDAVGWHECTSQRAQRQENRRHASTNRRLASSITAKLEKISDDAHTATQNFNDLSALIFVTSGKVGNQKKSDWAAKIRKTYGLDLHIISREDIIISLMLPRNTSLCPRFLGISIEIEPAQGDDSSH